MRIPFDNVALSAVVSELQEFVGGFVQEVRQPDEHTITLGIYRRGELDKGKEGVFLLSSHPQFARAHFVTRRVPNSATPPVFCATLRARVQGSELVSARQIASDRILIMNFASDKGDHTVIAELMGKHSNLMLLDQRRHVVSAAKWVSETKSSRPILSNAEYRWPPVLDVDQLGYDSPTDPAGWVDFAKIYPQRMSPFFRSLVAHDNSLTGDWQPCISPSRGAYPIDIRTLGLDAFSRGTLSIALEQYFASAEAMFEMESLRANLVGQIDRVVLARDIAIRDIENSLKTDEQADFWKLAGELILAFGPSAPKGLSSLDAYDYEGSPVTIPLDPELGFVENSKLFFDRAKKAKARVGHLIENGERLEQDRREALLLKENVLAATKLSDLQDLQAIAKTRRWLIRQFVAKTKEDRPFEGHRIRELLGPGGIRVLYGENAESNDYLTLRVAKPNDYWLHVRGSTSAHVVLVTGNAPERIGKEQLIFAAKVAVLNSTSKHAGYVPVDYTLKKYVRKPRGAAKGSALYTNEKTLHIES